MQIKLSCLGLGSSSHLLERHDAPVDGDMLYFVALQSPLCHHFPPFNCSPLFWLTWLLFAGEPSSPRTS